MGALFVKATAWPQDGRRVNGPFEDENLHSLKNLQRRCRGGAWRGGGPWLLQFPCGGDGNTLAGLMPLLRDPGLPAPAQGRLRSSRK